MVNRASFFQQHNEAGALHELVAPKCFVDESVFATGSGAVGMVLSLRGVDFETLTAESLDRVCDRFQNASRAFGPSFRIYQYLMKREGRRLPRAEQNGAVGRWQESRRQFLEERGLYSIDLFMVVLYEASSGNRLLSWLKGLSIQRTFNVLDRQVLDSIELLRHGVLSFTAQIEDLLGVQVLQKEAAFRFFRELLNPDPVVAAAVNLKHVVHVDFHAADTPVEWNVKPYMRWGEYHLRAFVLKDPPSRTLPEDRNKLAFLLRGIQKSIETNMIVCLEWKAQPFKQTHGTAKTRRRIRSGQTGISQRKSREGQQQLNDVDAQDDVAEIGEAQRELRRNRFGDLSLIVLLFDRDEAKVRRAYADLLGIHWDGTLVEEAALRSRFTTFLSVIPGNSSWNLRMIGPVSMTNYVDLSLLYRLDEGRAVNEHLKSSALSIFETEDRTPFFLNLHHFDVAHTSVLGATGSGKTTLCNQIIGDAQGFGGRTFILDIGASYKAITREFGGVYVSLDLAKQEFSANPFALPETETNLNFQHQFIRTLMANEGKNLSTEEDRDIYQRIRSLYLMSPEVRRLSWLNSILRPSLKGVLHRWIEGGPYARFFDNVEDTLELAHFQTFDFSEMKSHPQAIGPLMFYLFHRVDAVVHDPKLAAIPKTLYIDEGWMFILDWVTEAIKTWRKHNGWVVFITQSKGDLEQGHFFEVLRESCPNMIHLPNPGADADVYGPAFGLNARQLTLLHEKGPREGFLFTNPYGSHWLNYHPEPGWLKKYETQREEKALEATA